MKILQIINYPGQGGAEQYAFSLAKNAKVDGEEVFFVFGGDGPLVKKIKDLGVSYQIIKMRAPYDPFAVFQLAKIFKKFKPDIVHTHFMRENFLAIDASFLVPVRAIFTTVHRIEEKTPLQKMVNRFYSKFLTSFIAVSEVVREYLIDEGINQYKITVIAPGVQKEKVNREKIRREIEVSDDERVVTSVGRFTHEKGQKNLIKAFAKANLPKTTLILVGDGVLLEDLKKEVKKKKLDAKIKLIGGRDKAFEIVAISDLYIQPSKVETFGISVVEAMAQKVPVLVSNVKAFQGLLKDGKYGILFDYTDVNDLASKIPFALEVGKEKVKLAFDYYQMNFTEEKGWSNIKKTYLKYLK